MNENNTGVVMGTILDEELNVLRRAAIAPAFDSNDSEVEPGREGWRGARYLSPDQYLVLDWGKLVDWELLEVEYLNPDERMHEAQYRITNAGRDFVRSLGDTSDAPAIKTVWAADELVGDSPEVLALREAVAAGKALLRDRDGEVVTFPYFERDETFDFDYRYALASSGKPIICKAWAKFTASQVSAQLKAVAAVRAELPLNEPHVELVGRNGMVFEDMLGRCMAYAQNYARWEIGQQLDSALGTDGKASRRASGSLVGFVAGTVMRLRNMAAAHRRPTGEMSEYAALVQAVETTANHLQTALELE